MHTKESATRSVLKHLAAMERAMNAFGSARPGTGEEEHLFITRIDELDIGWVFFYDSQAHAQFGDFLHALAGNAPLIVDRQDGRLYETGTAQPTDFYIAQFRQGIRRAVLGS